MSTAEVAQPIKLAFDSAGLRMTPEEFDAVDDWDELYRYELIDGIVIVNPIPSEAEADPNELLGALLRIYERNHPNGKSLDGTLSERYIHFPNHRRRADRVIWAGLGRRPHPKTDVPTIAVEFVSRVKRNAERDYETKRDEHLAAGVQEYWIVDRFRRTRPRTPRGRADG
ncbi:MAG: Uma2 family endonuclease, partial [Planctomycetaceae bacterium]